MDKTWIKLPIHSQAYREGARHFIHFVSEKAVQGTISCPCVRCCNEKRWTCDAVHSHILKYGFLHGYTTWVFHGEKVTPEHDTSENRMPQFGQTSAACLNSETMHDLRSLLRDVVRHAYVNSSTDQDEVDGEIGETTEIIENMVEDADQGRDGDVGVTHNNIQSDKQHPSPLPNVNGTRFQKLVDDCDEKLYDGCKYSKLAFNLQLYHLKCLGGLSNKIFTMLLELLKDVFPFLTSLPSSTNEFKKLTNELGLGYEKIHACPNDCMLYWGPTINEQSCNVCGASRYKSQHNEATNAEADDLNSCKSVKPKPAKVLRYFPLIPRLKRIYSCATMAKDMRWHHTDRPRDGKLRHPADGLAWKEFDNRYKGFASDPRSVRLGLASDGFNPFRTMSTTYSTWPVILIPYNLPPWLCMKQTSFILSMIIPGEKGPGNDIDVYLQPLIHELNMLWNGIDAYDAFAKEHFTLQAALHSTTNDFPAYANLSGWSTKGRVACPSCTTSTHSIWLKHGKKFSYMGHRRWLESNHPYRLQRDMFDGSMEFGSPPTQPSGCDILKELNGISFKYGKTSKSSNKRVREDRGNLTPYAFQEHAIDDPNSTTHVDVVENTNDDFIEDDVDGEQVLWKKRSIFFDLPYWEHNLLRHNLDVMHIEKNVCDNLLGTLLNVDGKSKDNEKARRDLMDMGIKPELHVIDHPNKKSYIPHACYTLSASEKSVFLQVLKDLKVPDGYASNISRGVNLKDRKLTNLKSHDCHILMQDLLPIACRASMHSDDQKKVVKVISELCYFFKAICAKVLDPCELDELQNRVVRTLCDLEAIFPPSFFTIMVHLIIHLVSEAKLGGPVFYRWMYPIERFLMVLKSSVGNRAQPEGSMAERYIANECLIFCSRYFKGVETRLNRGQRNNDSEVNKEKYLFNSGGRIIGAVESVQLDDNSHAQAHRYVLLHSDHINPYLEKFLHERRTTYCGRVTDRLEAKWIVEDFSSWLRDQVLSMERENCGEEIIALARGPSTYVKKYKAFIINGYRFHTKDRELQRNTQNSGVVVEVNGGNGISQNYYGQIHEIYELDYYGRFKVVLFKCKWVNIKSARGFKVDKFGFPLVNFLQPIHTGRNLKDDPFVLSSQVKQVFYVDDCRDGNWKHIIRTKPRDLYDMGTNVEDDDGESYTEFCPPIRQG